MPVSPTDTVTVRGVGNVPVAVADTATCVPGAPSLMLDGIAESEMGWASVSVIDVPWPA